MKLEVIEVLKESIYTKGQLDDVYPFVFIDAIHFSVREDNHIGLYCFKNQFRGV